MSIVICHIGHFTTHISMIHVILKIQNSKLYTQNINSFGIYAKFCTFLHHFARSDLGGGMYNAPMD